MNTVLSLASCCVVSVIVSRILSEENKINMEVLLNATLAGGVAIGSSADLCADPWATLLIGAISAVLSAVGFMKIGGFL